jgi:FkbM family methyltransferase
MRFLLKAFHKIGILSFLNISPRKRVWGKRRSIPILGGVGLDNYLDLSEQWLYELLFLLEKNKKRSGAFLDVGVNVGQTLIKVKAQKRDISYLGFEPNPECVHYVNRLVKVNQFKNVQVLPVAIGNQTGIQKLLFFSDQLTDSSASIVSEFRASSSVTGASNVPVMKFEDLRLPNIDVSYLKIDVEGGELEVLRELHSILHDQKPLIFIEILPVYDKQNSLRLERQNSIEDVVSKLNYQIFRINRNSCSFTHLEKIDNLGIHSDLDLCDYLLVPIEEATELTDLMTISS